MNKYIIVKPIHSFLLSKSKTKNVYPTQKILNYFNIYTLFMLKNIKTFRAMYLRFTNTVNVCY